jgi:hypothetical protein
MTINTFTEAEARRLPGLIELVSERKYTESQARRRLNGTLPKDLTPFGFPIIIALDREPGSRRTRCLAAWHVAEYARTANN